MRVSIITADNTVIVDGYAITTLDLGTLPADVWAIQWLGDTGHIEYTDGSNSDLDNIDAYSDIIAAHAAAKDAIDNPVYSPAERLEQKIRLIAEANSQANAADFSYNGEIFVGDKESIQATQNQCLLMSDSDNIPTPNGQWVLADDTVKSMTVGEFKAFATAFYMRGSNNFGVKKQHEAQVRGLFNNGATAQEIWNYDHTSGWF